MIVVDPLKVQALREMIDTDVADLVISENMSRDVAYLAYAAQQLETNLCLHRTSTGWHSVLAIEGSAYHAFQGPLERLAYGYMSPDEAARWETASTLVGRNPELLVIAAILRLVDADADVSMDCITFDHYYGRHAWAEVASAVAFDPEIMSTPAQTLLFDTAYDAALRPACNALLKAKQRVVVSEVNEYLDDAGLVLKTPMDR